MFDNFNNSSIPVDTPFGPGRLIIKVVRYTAPSGRVLEQRQGILTVQDEHGRFVTIDITDLASLDNGAILTEKNSDLLRQCDLCGGLTINGFQCPCGLMVDPCCTAKITNSDGVKELRCWKCVHPILYFFKSLNGEKYVLENKQE